MKDVKHWILCPPQVNVNTRFNVSGHRDIDMRLIHYAPWGQFKHQISSACHIFTQWQVMTLNKKPDCVHVTSKDQKFFIFILLLLRTALTCKRHSTDYRTRTFETVKSLQGILLLYNTSQPKWYYRPDNAICSWSGYSKNEWARVGWREATMSNTEKKKNRGSQGVKFYYGQCFVDTELGKNSANER